MGQIVSDDFNRANSTGLGANWTSSVGGGFDVVSNHASSAITGGNDNAAVYSGAGWTGGNDQYSEAQIITKPSGQDAGVICRGATGAETFYLYDVNFDDAAVALGSSMTNRMYKTVGGSFTQLGSNSVETVSSGDVLRVEANGTSITAKRGGVTKIGPITDSAIASGKPGLFGFGPGNVFDNWAAGDFSSGTTPFIAAWKLPFAMPDFSNSVVSV